ncbi:hypothetical protein F5141DRAFT_1098530 [Pisolithus sp. B1]|nr:hypothetical protein F5141DRAFT_1098530 [Pisolithus sp. B1]
MLVNDAPPAEILDIPDVIDQERDEGLRNGDIGHLTACYFDSSSTRELPIWGYGLSYKYNIFQRDRTVGSRQSAGECSSWYHRIAQIRLSSSSTGMKRRCIYIELLGNARTISLEFLMGRTLDNTSLILV